MNHHVGDEFVPESLPHVGLKSSVEEDTSTKSTWKRD